MATEQPFENIVEDIINEKKLGALYINVVENSEDLIRMYFKDGEIYHMRYGTAVGNDCLEVLEYYHLHDAMFFDGISAPDKHASDLPPTKVILKRIRKMEQKIKDK